MRCLAVALAALSLSVVPSAPRADSAEALAACEKALPAAAASKALGRPVKLQGNAVIGLVVACSYQEGGAPVVTLQLSPKITKQQYDDLYVASAQGKGKPLTGVGDEAFTSSTAAPLGGTMSNACGRKKEAAFCVSSGMDPRTAKVLATDAQVLAVAKALAAKL